MSQKSSSPRAKKRNLPLRLFRALFSLALLFIYLLGTAWAAGAVYFDAPLVGESGMDRWFLAIGYLLVVLLGLLALGSPLRRFLAWVAAMAIVLIPWSLKQPKITADWMPAWSRLPSATIVGDSVTFHDFRNFDYTLDGTTTKRWEERTVHLSKLKGLDYFHHAFHQDLLAHPILSFDFGEDGQVAFSIEVRYEVGLDYTPVRGLYKQYGLIYLVGDERDFVRDRANVRGEPVRLFRSSYPQQRIREIFLETVEAMNQLKTTPRFYHTVLANCTTSYLTQAPPEKRARFDYRIIANGRIESLLYERRAIERHGLSFQDLLEQSTINEAAKKAHDDPAFSARICEDRPGF